MIYCRSETVFRLFVWYLLKKFEAFFIEVLKFHDCGEF